MTCKSEVSEKSNIAKEIQMTAMRHCRSFPLFLLISACVFALIP